MIKKNIVLYVSGFYYGGVEEFVTNVAGNLNKEIYNVSILVRYADTASKAYNKLIQKGIVIHSLNIQHLNIRTMKLFKGSLNKFFKEHQVDFLHINGLDEPIICMVAKRYHIRMALHVHEPKRELGGTLKRFVKNGIERFNVKLVDTYLACSEETGHLIYDKYQNVKFKVIVNGIVNDDFKYKKAVREEIRNYYKYEPNNKVIGHVGRFTDVKNQEWVIEVFNAVFVHDKTYRLFLVGQGEDWQRINDLVKQKELEKYVLMIGESEEVPKILQAFDLFIMPSKFEGLGLALIEAQSAGLKCVISDNIPNEAIVTELVEKKSLQSSAECWSEAIEKVDLNYDRTIYSEIVKDSKFDISYTCRQLEEVYGV